MATPSSGWKSHATQQVLEARVGPQPIEQRINFHKNHERISPLVGSLKAGQGLVLVSEAQVEPRHNIWRQVPLFRKACSMHFV